jgi:Protein of unknown function (DUF1186)/SEC-C motif
MTIPEILDEFSLFADHPPVDALSEARRQRETITPELLRILEDAVASQRDQSFVPAGQSLEYAIFLLAEFREKRAFPLIINFFREAALDDVILDLLFNLGRVFASVYDGNPLPLLALIEDRDLHVLVRSEAARAIPALVRSRQLELESAISYYRPLLNGGVDIKEEFAPIWTRLVTGIIDLQARELIDDVRRVTAQGALDGVTYTIDDIEREFETGAPNRDQNYALVDDAVSEIVEWAIFALNDPETDNFDPFYDLDEPEEPTPLGEWAGLPSTSPPEFSFSLPPRPVLADPKIGRNDPCPCGSGRKFKKCCGA